MKVNDVSLYNKFPYVHLLGFTKNGQKALNIMKKNSEIPLLAKISQQDKDDFYHVDYRAGKIYQSQNYKEQDLKKSPIDILRCQGKNIDKGLNESYNQICCIGRNIT